jgi:hypothetical protein
MNGSRSRYQRRVIGKAAEPLGSCDKTASMVAEMEMHLESSHGFSGGGFGATLAARYFEEAKDINQVVVAADGGS